jgi:hypothetical protein
VYFNTIIPSTTLSPGLLIGLFLLKLCLSICHLWHAHYVPSITSSLVPSPWYYLMKGTNCKVYYAVSSSVTSCSFRPWIVNMCSCTNSHQSKTAGKITYLCVLIFRRFMCKMVAAFPVVTSIYVDRIENKFTRRVIS